jgi:hypothetical protein
MERLYSDDGWSYKDIENPTKEEEKLLKKQAEERHIKRPKKPLSITPTTQKTLILSLEAKRENLLAEVGKISKEIEQAQKVLEELQIKEHLSKLSKEELLEDAYLREVKGNSLEGLSQDELDTVLKVLTKIRSEKG